MVAEEAKKHCQSLIDFIDSSPSPWHVVANISSRLLSAGYIGLKESDSWNIEPGGRYFVIRDESSIVVFTVGQKVDLFKSGFNIIGAHVDSPGMRVKPNGASAKDAHVRLGVEVYGGPILATFTDRDLSLAGRVVTRSQTSSVQVESRLVCFEKPLLRLPNAAIHLNREVNEKGLLLDKQDELPPILSALDEELGAEKQFRVMLGEKLSVDSDQIMAWDLAVFDTQPGQFFGPDEEFFADSQIDNLTSCHAALEALLRVDLAMQTGINVCAFFDHEEVGSTSSKGAGGRFLPDVLERIAVACVTNGDGFKRACAASFMLSVDMTHGYHPGYSKYYDADHQVRLNHGPAIKVNANQRYTTDSMSEARYMLCCESAGVPCQKYVHRTNLLCGSTIGPQLSALLGIHSVDIGCPMWSMHSLRESAGVLDQLWLAQSLEAFLLHNV